MGRCRKCDLSRVYKQFAEKKARKEAEAKAAVAQKAPEVIAVEEVKEPEAVVVQEIKRVVKTRKKKEPVAEIVETSAEENNSEAVENKVEEE